MAVRVVDHPLVRHKLGILRTASTATHEFRTVANELERFNFENYHIRMKRTSLWHRLR